MNCFKVFAGFAKQVTFDKWNIVKGDKVILLSGKDKGKSGAVMRVYRKSNEVLIMGINQKFRRSAKSEETQGGIQTVTRPVHVSKVALIDPENGKHTKVSRGYLEDGTPARLSKTSGALIPRPKDPAHNYTFRHKNKVDGVKDTPPNLAIKVTYEGEDFHDIKLEFDEFIRQKELKESLLIFDK